MTYCTLVAEDDLSAEVLRCIVQFSNPRLIVHNTRVMGGFGQIKKNIHAFNNAAREMPYIVLTDLDNNPTPIELIDDWMGRRQRNVSFVFRIAVREVEAWLLADQSGFSSFLGISKKLLPAKPEALIDAKSTLFNLTRRSRKSELRRAILPVGTASQGPDYNATLIDFVADKWDIQEAIMSSDSLRRASLRISQI